MDEPDSSEWGGEGYQQMSSPWVAGFDLGSLTKGVDVLLAVQNTGFGAGLFPTRHVPGLLTAEFQMVFVTDSQSLPSCFEKLLQLRSFWMEIY